MALLTIENKIAYANICSYGFKVVISHILTTCCFLSTLHAIIQSLLIT